MRSEFKLILKSVLINKTEEDVNEISNLLEQDNDWFLIGGVLLNHRLSGYFYNGLTAEQKSKLPKEFGKMLEFIVNAQREKMEGMVELVNEATEALNKANVRYSGLKGILFNADFYNFSDRRSNDIDFLVFEDDLDKMDKALREVGYVQSFAENGELVEASRKEKVIQRMNYHDLVPYVKKNKDSIFMLDINFKFDSTLHEIDDRVFEYGTVMYDKNGLNVKGLKFYTHLMFLCVHFYREATNAIWKKENRDFTLYKLVDLYNCLRAHISEFDANEWCDLVKSFDTTKHCLFSFNALKEFYDDELFDSIIDNLSSATKLDENEERQFFDVVFNGFKQ